jgi:membrane protease YdiL (CAAX protease family)
MSEPAGDIAATTAARRSLTLLFIRVASVAAVTFAAWLVIVVFEPSATFPPSPMLASLVLLPVNLLSLYVVMRLLRHEGQTLRTLFAPRRGRLMLADVAWGLLWIVVLYVPFAAAIMGTMWLLHGDDMLARFSTVFYDPDASVAVSPAWALALGIVAFLTFAPLNAPAEEAVFRGYAQSRLSTAWPRAATVVVCSLAFGIQHAFFAPTADAMIVYAVAFTVWGLGSALIVLAQRRLVPITLAHFVVNLATSSPAVVFPALQLAGVVPT